MTDVKIKYTERTYTSKKGLSCLESSVYGRCEVITKEELKDLLDDNEELYPCENIRASKYKFYVDMEIARHYAVLKK